MADPKQTTTQPDAKHDATIPVKKIVFQPGENLSLPGNKISNSLTGEEPSGGQFYSIGYIPRLRSFRVAYYEVGKDLTRAPSQVVMVMESAVRMWTPMVAL